MKLTIDIDLDAVSENTAPEVGRILRYWAGAVGQIDLTAPAEHALLDSAYAEVGRIRIVEG